MAIIKHPGSGEAVTRLTDSELSKHELKLREILCVRKDTATNLHYQSYQIGVYHGHRAIAELLQYIKQIEQQVSKSE